jgi:GGDEF domain-containing protein
MRFLENVYAGCRGINEEPFGSPSISMGFAIKYNPGESINDIIDKADFLMYESKRNFKNAAAADKYNYRGALN